MTGFGKARFELSGKKIQIEIRSLNSKQLDVNSKLPSLYKEKEIEIRRIISNSLERGKIDISIICEDYGESAKFSLNKKLVYHYYDELLDISKELKIDRDTDYLSIVMRFPDILKAEADVLDESEWEKVKMMLAEAISECDRFRLAEGKLIEEDFRNRTQMIINMLTETKFYEKNRIDEIRTRIKKDLKEYTDESQYDKNRFEQELLYYIEKLDITEEMVRLKKHCDYFIETLEEEQSSGKKLSFIAQEMGREINTLGSKANNVNMQQIVVRMKDELEKIKEQLFNVL